MYVNNIRQIKEENTSQTLSSTSSSSHGKPYLTIKNKLPEVFRFRYLSEDGSHGGLQPIIELHDYDDPSNIYIEASLYTNENIPKLHTNFLHGNHCDNGVCRVELSSDFTAEFPVLPIAIKKRDETKKILKRRMLEKYRTKGKSITEQALKEKLKIELKRWDIKSVKFCFEAFHRKDKNKPICEKIFSNPIKSTRKGKKCFEKLNIHRLSKYSGKTSGEEDMILLCDKIHEDDLENIEIVFFSLDDDQNEDWKEYVKFNSTDVHYQVAICFKTPAYKDKTVEKDVFIQLRRNSDEVTSNTVKFHYKPVHKLEPELIHQTKKRKIHELPEAGHSEPLTSSLTTKNVKDPVDGNLELKPPETLLNGDPVWGDIRWSMSELFPDLCSEEVTAEGLVNNLASLNINEKTSEVTVNKSCSAETEQENMLKNIAIKLIKESKKDSFFKFFLTLMSFKDKDENNLLHLLVLEESENLYLLSKKLKYAPNDLINQVNKMHMTPLLIAVSNNLWRIVRILMKFGADPNIKDKNGNNSIHLAAMLNFPLCMREVLAPLLADSIQKYLPDINGFNSDGLAPLHLSIMNNSEICTKLLFQAKAVVNITDKKYGKTPLHFAYEKRSGLVRFLLMHPEINPNAKDSSGNIPSSCLPRTAKNSSSAESNKIGPEIFSESKSSEVIYDCGDEKHKILTSDKKNHIDENEPAFCDKLNSNGLWKKLALYIIDEKEINFIAVMDPDPTHTLLRILKKHHGAEYNKKLKDILVDDSELNQYAELLHL